MRTVRDSSVAPHVDPQRTGVRPDDTLRHAASVMHRSALTSLPVLQDDAVIGVLTQRGVMRAVADCEHPCESRVFDYMDTGPVTVSPDDDVAVAVLRMLAIGCLDIPVVQQQALVGTVSGRGLIAAQVQLLGVSV